MSDSLLEIFREEATDSVARLSTLLLDLERSSDGERQHMLQEIFRYAHSLKGSAFAADRSDLAQVAHALESSLDKLRRGQLELSSALIDASLSAVDLIGSGIDRALQQEELRKAQDVLARADGSAGGGKAPASTSSLSPSSSAASALVSDVEAEPRTWAAPTREERTDAEVQTDLLFGALTRLGRNELQGLTDASAAADALAENPAAHSAMLESVTRYLRPVAHALGRNGEVHRPALMALLSAVDLLQSAWQDLATDEEAAAVGKLLSTVAPISVVPTPAAPTPASPPAARQPFADPYAPARKSGAPAVTGSAPTPLLDESAFASPPSPSPASSSGADARVTAAIPSSTTGGGYGSPTVSAAPGALGATESNGHTNGHGAASSARTASGAKAEQSSVRIPTALLDTVLYRLDEMTTVKLRMEHQRRQLEEAQDFVEELVSQARGMDVTNAASESPGVMPDALTGAALEDLKRKLEALRRELDTDVHDLGVHIQALTEDVKEVRMVPVGPMLDALRRTVRGGATSLGKEAALEVHGEDVRVDKRVLELLRDPLLHLLRNALDHGLETPDERFAAGKERLGIIRIHAESRESQIVIHIQDDGRGLDLERVRETAVERGLVDKTRAAALSPREVLAFIFMPGFSTRKNVTETSGRGVGLDVVSENVARLGGRIDFHSQAGQGTEFIVSLPLTLASARGLFVRVGRSVYCLPLSNVDEAIAFEPNDVGVAQGRLFLHLRRLAMPYATLEDVLAQRPPQRPHRRGFAVILAVSDRRLALGVDELLGQEEVVVKALVAGTPKLPLVAGGTSLADGRLVVVLEPAPVVDAAAALGAGVRFRLEENPAKAATVLVCDDALTTRTMLASLLERAGYRVLLASDGEAAYGLLSRESADLVVSDVEMPILDGFSLTARIRTHPKLFRLPVVLVTSLGEPAERARGAEAGATAYVVKKNFEPQLFLEMVASLLAGGDGVSKPSG